MSVSPILITRIHKDHPKEQIIRDINSATQTRKMIKMSEEHAMVSYINKQRRTNHKDYQNCLFAYFLSQIEPKKVIQALTNPSWKEAMQEELLQFKLQKVWTLVDLPKGKRAIEQSVVIEIRKIERNIVMQRDDGIFISQDKYVAGILKKFDFSLVKTTSTLIETNKALLKDKEAKDVDVHLYRSMIRSLMYLTASRPNIMFVVCACSRFQVTPKTSHLHVVKRIFRYLKGQPKLGRWYLKDSPFDLEAFSDSDYADYPDRKSTTGAEYVAAAICYGQVLWIQNQMLDYGFNFMNTKIYIDNESTICIVKNPVFHSKTKHIEIRNHFIRDSYEKKLIQVACLERTKENAEFHQIVDFLTTSSIHYALTQIHATVDGKIVVISESSVRSDLHFNDEDDGVVFKERDDKVVRATTTAASLDVAQASGVNTLESDEGRNEQQDLTDFVPPTPHDSPLSGGHTLGSDEGRPNINELMAICTNLSNRVLALEQSKTAQDLGINKLQKKVKRLEKALRGRKSDKTKPMFKDSDFDMLDDVMENVEGGSTVEQITTTGDTLNTASINVSTAGPSNGSVAGPSTKEPRRVTPVPTVQSQDKDKGEMVEPEPTLKNPIKSHIQMDKELAQRMDADELLAARLQEQEREQFSVDEQARFLVETIAARKKFFAAQRAAEIRNRPPTRTQLRNQMITYLKHMGKQIDDLHHTGKRKVDDIIFGSIKKSLCAEFEKMMHKKFQMSSMGEITFFLGLQVKQKEDGIFISQDKYMTKILKKFGFTDVKTASTPMETQKPLLKDEDGEEVDVHLYRSMIGSLMYLTSSRPDIMFVVCACARYQVNPKVSHLYVVKRIFRYLKGQPKLGLWYPKDSPFDLVAYTDSDYAGASLDRKSTT
ncbi:putative ribonuclease H-like domain-containing protein [Tanacetum coccineum]|uniref:Ribonuclease H-like domain-containing protein n=1 Tax=Tanacetum coccineum TaxID=301880 RepID=A0ABQ5DFU1_9ASTR